MISNLTNIIRSLFDSVILNAIIICVICFYYYSTYSHKWRKFNVPHSRPVPLFGNTFKMNMGLEHQVDTFDRIYNQFSNEKFCGFYQMMTPYLMIRDPELINRIMVQDFSYFNDHGLEADPAINLLANSLFFLSGQKWKTMRQKLNTGFTPAKLRKTHDLINECSEQLMVYIDEKLKQNDIIEMKQIAGKFSTDAIGTCAFGLKLDAIKNDNSEFRIHTKILFQPSIRKYFIQLLVMFCPKLVKILKLQLYPRETTHFFNSVFSDVIKYRNKNNVFRNDLTQTLIEARKELVLNNDLIDDNKFTELDIIGNAVLMFSSGSGTVASTLAFCFYELALNKDVQDKLRKEIIITKEKHNGQINNDFLTDLYYANMVLDETARMYSITCTILRKATKNYKVPNESLVIEKGQKIIIPMYNIHHNPIYYSNPHIFNPERFSTEQKPTQLNGTFIPFGDGPRLCIGKRFAELEMKLVLSKILSQYEVLPCEKTEQPIDIRSKTGFISPKNGIWLSLKPIVN
ncbi:Cytochrome P450, conserved site,Cytochrome P450,Cytochrome P450, E-class, group I [Cinara cedri]|uniref:Cytochrome P450, conserved site,Cytochrome P450,Cytochrome P450, E-class, group I n=1 Tax=Cinara cedri TaxID=506608 RepID=A0A5E4N3Z7_9HEMI|nr:Cytochrome P450, conserved site,Cytochrome P450,Cytochrome P450, E-class, group I [Cinara cedri]